MKKLKNILSMAFLVFFTALIAFHIFSNIVENIRLVFGGTVTQGIISNTGNCPKRSHSTSMWVQFTDIHGKQQYAAVEDGCGYIGLPLREDGDHVSIVYLPNTPTLARIQSDLILQFWLLEFPFFLLVFLILFFALFLVYARHWLRSHRS